MICRLSFVLTILAFFMLTATAVPVAVDPGVAGSLMGRTYAQRAAEGEVLEARSEIVADVPVEVAARGDFVSHGERLLRRAQLSRRSVPRHAEPAIVRRAPEPKPAQPLKIVHLVARSNSNSLH
jgi:hypothetical protein